MLNKTSGWLFWLLFFGFFFVFTVPNIVSYATHGLPRYMGDSLWHNQLRFVLHALFGTLVYITGFIQLTPYFRNRNLRLHRKLGKVYIISSLLCICSLILMLPEGQCTACRPSQYMVTSLWLVFISLAWYFIRLRKIEMHRRCMISSFICAAYFVSVRVVDRFAMGLFKAVTKDETMALFVSDTAVWLLPLLFFWIVWLSRDFQGKPGINP